MKLSRKEASRYIKEQQPSVFLQRDRMNKGYICPLCSNGSGKTGDGLRRIPGTDSYKCFKCGFSGDNFDLIGAKFGLNGFTEEFNKGIELFNISIIQGTDISKDTVPKNNAPIKTDKNETAYIERCHACVNETDYFSKRGITKESINAFSLGYDASFKEGTGNEMWKAVIFPTDDNSFEARNTGVEADSKDYSDKKYRKHGPTRIFNRKVLITEKEKPIFITEGIIDAISLIQNGGQAIALGSTANCTLLLKELDEIAPAVPLIIALDNDEPGQKASETISRQLEERKIPYINADRLLDGYHDANEMMLADAEEFKKRISDVVKSAQNILFPVNEALETYLRTNAANSLNQFKKFINDNDRIKYMETGFPKIDRMLDGGIYTGLYVIGAVSSLGKTTFMLQISDTLAANGCDVLFFSLEQSKFDLMSKSISRETYIHCRENNISEKHAKTSREILNGEQADDEAIENAFEKYSDYSKHLFIHEGIGNITVAEIRNNIKKHISITNKKPVVIIDYIQILKASKGDEKSSDKQIMDHNITALKQLSRDFDIPVIAISSLNRQSYTENITMSSFKESGGIEYGTDVLIGLQAAAAEKNSKITEPDARQNIRNIEFIILKNRNGRTSSNGTTLKYFPAYNYFTEEE